MTLSEFSHVIGASHPPLREDTIGEALELAAQRWPDDDAVVARHGNVRYSWSELKAVTDAFAAGLLALGIGRGDRVGIWAPNCAQWTIAQLATARAGMILVNINPAYRIGELEYTLAKVDVKALICAASFKTSDYVAMTEALVTRFGEGPGEIVSDRLPALRYLIKIDGDRRPGWLDFDDVAASRTPTSEAELASVAVTLQASDPINIQFTSGTTGSPKGVTLSHRNVLNNASMCGTAMGAVAGDRICIAVPLYHCFGMVMSNLMSVIHGVTMIYPSPRFDPLAVLETVEAERCTILHGVPTMFIAELEHPEFPRFDLSTLRTGLMAGSPCPEELMRKVMTRMHMRDIGIAYGMTETSPVSFQTSLDDPIEVRVGTIGCIQPHLEAKVVNPETGTTVMRGEPGELCIRGYSVMLGYWGDLEKTAEVVRHGWMHSGDIAVIDGEGYARIVGRIKDMIIRGGENIYPRELEELIYLHPSVLDVQVVGVPDAKFGEEVVACVKLRPGEPEDADAIIAFCRGRVAHYKVPRYVRFMDSFPMTVSGKVQKFQLREMMEAELAKADG